MHVFIDTNIFLSFFHYSSDELDRLNDVFADHQYGAATVYLTEQVKDEFVRNRDSKLKDALKRFNSSNLNPEFPSFMKGFEEYEVLQDHLKQYKKLRSSLLNKVTDSIEGEVLSADNLLKKIFEEATSISIAEEIFTSAQTRMARGNPPGKNDSLGDAINWEILLSEVPDGNDVHIISADGDFFSKLDENLPNAFLRKEWISEKTGDLFVYRTLSEFVNEHFDGVAFAYDKDKQDLIDSLRHAGNFSVTHQLIAKLSKYTYFSLSEVEQILEAAYLNDQFGWIVNDADVEEFLVAHAVPRYSELSDAQHKDILKDVMD